MDKTAIRNFAIEARKILMKSAIAEAGFYGISKDGVKAPIQKGKDFEVYETLAGTEKRIFGDDIKRRENLANAVREFGFDQVIEETAYTWFNRIIAIRFMEVNNYLPTRVRVLSSETGSSTPDIVTQADTVELNISVAELESIQQSKQDNKYDEAFRLLFIKQCNELNAILPGLFEKTNDYMELLLKISYTGDGVIRMLVDTIPEDNFNVETEGQVEIIGWMYQYYNTELKDDTFAKLKKNVKITKERIPAATQLFTPDWIVRYMVENSLGRIWIEHLRAVNSLVDEKAKAEEFGWKYYLPEAEQEENVAAQLVEIRQSYKDLSPQDITCIDPCMGSGHILVYMFDVLMDIYRSEGFSEREAVFDILEKNIRGLDIDRRAYQLSYFALMMKARGYNRVFFRGRENIEGKRVQAVPQVYAIEESNSVNRNQLKYFGEELSDIEKNDAINQMNGLLDQLIDAREYGSVLKVESYNWSLLKRLTDNFGIPGQMDFEMIGLEKTQLRIKHLINEGILLNQKYNVVITNPPYMGANGMSNKLSTFVKNEYSDSKADLFAVFIEKCSSMVEKTGYLAMITQHAWMFLSSYENLRMKVQNMNVVNMAHLGSRAFEEIGGEVVQTTSFVIGKKNVLKYKGSYVRLTEFGSQVEKERGFLNGENVFYTSMDCFEKIPGNPIAYWVTKKILSAFINAPSLADLCAPKVGLQSGNSEKYYKLWPEVNFKSISFEGDKSFKWYPCIKGGEAKKWYGNNVSVIDWENDGRGIRNETSAVVRNPGYYFKSGLTWTKITSTFAVRYFPSNMILSDSSVYVFPEEKEYILGLLNSKVTPTIVGMLNPTLNFVATTIGAIPVIVSNNSKIKELVNECIDIAKDDWDSSELSWDYKVHPLLTFETNSIRDAWRKWDELTQKRFKKVKENEEELNKIFIEIYGLENELEPYVSDDEISISLADKSRDIRSLLSYAVGCMFGRYSLDSSGISYAGGEWNASQYKKYIPDIDGIIPITDEEYFKDDIVGLLSDWLIAVFGEKNLDDNLLFIAENLGTRGNSSKDRIRNYFINDFYKDHCNMYSFSGSGKRPIFWMFDSGKNNGFKCLIYMHRYTKELVGIIKSDYLVKAQSAIENALKNVEYVLGSQTGAVDKARATKDRDRYIKQLSEIKQYYPALSHIALQNIELDFDEGVKNNYLKFQNVDVVAESGKKQTIDLLAKI